MNELSKSIAVFKAFATLSGLAGMFFQLTQGSALTHATLGWRLVNAFGVRIRVA